MAPGGGIKSGARPWTEAEKFGILWQIIEKAGPIAYNELVLPESRTLKAVRVMLDKEKHKYRKAAAEAGGTPGVNGDDANEDEEQNDEPVTKKRKLNAGDAESKKVKGARRKLVKAGPDEEDRVEPEAGTKHTSDDEE